MLEFFFAFVLAVLSPLPARPVASPERLPRTHRIGPARCHTCD
jgi:hypothetical protein